MECAKTKRPQKMGCKGPLDARINALKSSQRARSYAGYQNPKNNIVCTNFVYFLNSLTKPPLKLSIFDFLKKKENHEWKLKNKLNDGQNEDKTNEQINLWPFVFSSFCLYFVFVLPSFHDFGTYMPPMRVSAWGSGN